MALAPHSRSIVVVTLFISMFWSACYNGFLKMTDFSQNWNSELNNFDTITHALERENNGTLIEREEKTPSFGTVFLQKVSGIFDDDPFRDFRKELSWIPNRTLIPWEQLNREAPCIISKDALNPKKQRTPTTRGILYIKPEKSASSTIAGVAARIAYKLFDLTNTSAVLSTQGIKVKTPACQLRITHGWSDNRHHPETLSSRIRNESFLFTFLRNPAQRVLSAFYYFGVDGKNITGKETEPNTTEVIEYMKTHANGQFEKCLDKKQKRLHSGNWSNRERFALQVQTIIDELDFIGIVERMEYVNDSCTVIFLLIARFAYICSLLPQRIASGLTALTGFWPKTERCSFLFSKRV